MIRCSLIRGRRPAQGPRLLALLWVLLIPVMIGCGGGGSGDTTPDGSAGGCSGALPTCPATPPSYQTDVAPVVMNNCLACHGPGGSQQSSQDLSTYDGLYRWRTDVLTQVYNCRMPPGGWPPMSASDRQTLLTWLVCGAPNN